MYTVTRSGLLFMCGVNDEYVVIEHCRCVSFHLSLLGLFFISLNPKLLLSLSEN